MRKIFKKISVALVLGLLFILAIIGLLVVIGVLVGSIPCADGAAETALHAPTIRQNLDGSDGKRFIIVDDDVGFDALGCLFNGFVHQYRDSNPDYTGHDHLLSAIDIACDTDGGLQIIYNVWMDETRDDVELLGITTMHGVSTSDVTYRSAVQLLCHMGRNDIPVFQGALNGAADLGKETPAVRFIIDTVMANPGQVEILATGPLTNISTAMMLEPRIVDNWKQIYLGSGNFSDELVPGYKYLGKDMGQPEMNGNMDPEAMRYFVANAKNATWFSGESSEAHPWCFSFPGDWCEMALSGLRGSSFHRYAALQMLPWMIFISTIGHEKVGGSWSACGADSGVTISSLLYFEEFRGEYVDSAIDVIADPYLQDGSISNTLSQDPNRPVHRIYYSVSSETEKIYDQVVEAIYHYSVI